MLAHITQFAKTGWENDTNTNGCLLYTSDDELARLIGKRAADFYEYAISQANGCLVGSIYCRNLLKKNGIDFDTFGSVSYTHLPPASWSSVSKVPTRRSPTTMITAS